MMPNGVYNEVSTLGLFNEKQYYLYRFSLHKQIKKEFYTIVLITVILS